MGRDSDHKPRKKQAEPPDLTALRDDPELDPYEIEFLPEYREGRGPSGPFVNEHGVVIGDHDYASPNSPLENWTEETDPAVMSGDEWVHPFKDVGFHTEENRQLFEQGIQPQAGIFMHPDKDAVFEAYRQSDNADDDSGSQPSEKQPDA
jgi:hypothetical protein